MCKKPVCHSVIYFLCITIFSCSPLPEADLILVNGKIRTMNEAAPQAEAIAVRSGKIVAIGTTSSVEKLKGKNTERIDLQGRLLLPGFVDSHIHAFWGGQRLSEINLNGSESVAELQQKLKDWIEKSNIPEGEPIWGVGPFPNASLFGGVGWPTKAILDEVAPKHPVILSRGGGHAYWLNSMALARSGIKRGMAQPEGGEIVFDPVSGDPTGILKENAQDITTLAIPHPVDRRAVFEKAQEYANSLGLTGVTIMPLTTGQDGLSTLQQLNTEGQLKLRVYLGYAPVQLDSLIAAGAKTTDGDGMIQTGPIKIFMDGSLGALSAFLYEPFADDPGNSGIGRYKKEDLNALVQKANANNFQVAIHGIGDQAVTWALDAIEAAQEQTGNKNLRHRIEHNTMTIPSDVPRFHKLGVIASMQPHITGNQEYRERRLGVERAHQVDVWKDLLDSDAMLAWGTDWPVSSLNPIDIIYDIVTRYEEQRLTMEQAIKYYTYGSAYASHSEKLRGTLEIGKWADMVVLSNDLFSIAAEEIKNTKVVYTVVGGKIVYRQVP